ncbi:PPA1309 family protein [Prescottella subtropica]|uniref:PPA1309 family protein n=1 Tax=Prescottella subtropica TaxID=2545757 RepID=UPI001F501ED0|nr:PPA1309 family protein [Prescottella subtropica]
MDSNGVFSGDGPVGGGSHVSRSDESLRRCVHEVIDFVDGNGWGRPPVMFALVPTALIAAAEPSLLDQLDDGAELTPIEQESLPDDVEGGSPALDEFLATTSWPSEIVGCVLVQEIVVLPPAAELELDSAVDEAAAPALSDRHTADEAARTAAEGHPDRREARLIAAVLRDGPSIALLQLRPTDDDDPFAGLELRTYDNLAPGVVSALYATLEADPDL